MECWARKCLALGGVNYLAEQNSYQGLSQDAMIEYATTKANAALIGTWNPNSMTGVIYAEPMKQFSTTRRDFIKGKLKDLL